MRLLPTQLKQKFLVETLSHALERAFELAEAHLETGKAFLVEIGTRPFSLHIKEVSKHKIPHHYKAGHVYFKNSALSLSELFTQAHDHTSPLLARAHPEKHNLSTVSFIIDRATLEQLPRSNRDLAELISKFLTARDKAKAAGLEPADP